VELNVGLNNGPVQTKRGHSDKVLPVSTNWREKNILKKYWFMLNSKEEGGQPHIYNQYIYNIWN